MTDEANTINLLLINDPLFTELLSPLLKSHGYNIISASNGEAGMVAARRDPPDIIILDPTLAGMEQSYYCSHLREISTAPILVLSGKDSPSDVAYALDAGADDYLVTPISSRVLLAHLNTLTRRSQFNTHLP